MKGRHAFECILNTEPAFKLHTESGFDKARLNFHAFRRLLLYLNCIQSAGLRRDGVIYMHSLHSACTMMEYMEIIQSII